MVAAPAASNPTVTATATSSLSAAGRIANYGGYDGPFYGGWNGPSASNPAASRAAVHSSLAVSTPA